MKFDFASHHLIFENIYHQKFFKKKQKHKK